MQTPPPDRIEASPAFRRATLVAAFGLLGLELGLFAMAWRLGLLADPGADRRAALLFLLLGTALTLQAMVVAGISWLMVAVSRTSLVIENGGLILAHPWRRWRGPSSKVAHAWHRRGWLAIELSSSARRWYVRAGSESPALAAFREHLQPGAWLDGPRLNAHLMRRRLLPVAGVAIPAGGLALWALLRLLETLQD